MNCSATDSVICNLISSCLRSPPGSSYGIRVEAGKATFRSDAAGKWYIRFINMTRSDDPEIDYRSEWATITFEIL